MTPAEHKDFNVGVAAVSSNIQGFLAMSNKMPDAKAKARMYLGALNALAGIIVADIGLEDARCCLQATLLHGLAE